MSQRLGMADSRCITSFDSDRILNDTIMAQNRIVPEDNYSYRKFLQEKGPEALNLPMQNAACGGSKQFAPW